MRKAKNSREAGIVRGTASQELADKKLKDYRKAVFNRQKDLVPSEHDFKGNLDMTWIKSRYRQSRHDALKRNIEFELTFAEWFGIWQKSGKLSERGHRVGQYVMARHGDEGAYKIGNVRITTVTQNHTEMKHTSAHKVMLSKRVTGSKNPRSKLTPKQINDIRQLYASGTESQYTLATKYSVSQTCIGNVVRNITWNSVKPSEHDFTSGMRLEQWEDSVFVNADHFRLHRYYGQGQTDQMQVKTFPEALQQAQVELADGKRVLIYAVTRTGRFINCVKTRWDHYSKLWEQHHASS